MRKNWRGGDELLMKKWYIRWLRLLTVIFPGRIYIALGTWYLNDFRNIFLPNISKDQKKSYRLGAGPWHCAIL